MPSVGAHAHGRARPRAADALQDDEALQQLRAETAELLRLVKEPAGRRGNAAGRKRRVTIEVLDAGDDGLEDAVGGGGAEDRPRADQGAHAAPGTDPFDFAAEEARVRRAADTFYPDLSPTKRGLARQQDVLAKENARLDCIARREEETQARRRAAVTEGFSATNRLEVSAVKIQARCRGYLSRKSHPRQLERKHIAQQETVEVNRSATDQWHEVRDVEKGEVWYYNSATGQSQWERPLGFQPQQLLGGPQLLPGLPGSKSNPRGPESSASPSSVKARARAEDPYSSLPPLSPSSSACSSARSDADPQQSRNASGYVNLSASLTTKCSNTASFQSGTKSPSSLPSLRPDYSSLSQPVWECDSITTERSAASDEWRCNESIDTPGVFDRRQSPDTESYNEGETNGDWQVNDTLFRADGTRNSKLRDTIRQALQVSKFDSISSLLASNVVLRKKPTRGGNGAGESPQRQQSPSRSRSNGNQNSGKRDIVLGKRDALLFVAVLNGPRVGNAPSSAPKSVSKTKSKPGAVNKNPLANPPQIRDLTDPGFSSEDLRARNTPTSEDNILDHETINDDDQPQERIAPGATSPSKKGKTICFNCWSSSTGTFCDLHTDPRMATRKIKASASALMCANWELDQLRRKYRAEEIQEIFMKQNASLRYDRQRKTYVTVVECKHPIYRTVEQLGTAWNKTMRRKLHTRAWFRSFIEQLRAGQVPKADSSTPALMKLKNTLQNNRWCFKYSESVREFHPKAPVTAKSFKSDHFVQPTLDVITIDPDHPQLRHWILKTDCTKPVILYQPREYELPPRRCVPMPTPSFLEDVPLPVPNVFIDCSHIASWFERLAARVSKAALDKAALQIAACSPPIGVTKARRTKVVRPVTVMFATFGRKPTRGNLAVGGLSAELLIHMLVTTYVPAQFGNFVVFDRRSTAPTVSKDYDAAFSCLEIALNSPEFVFRALEHALNIRRPPCIMISTRVTPSETAFEALYISKRFPANRVEQTGEELAMGFRTFWLVDTRPVYEDGITAVQVAPSSEILSLNSTSMNPTMTTRADRHYPFCIPTTRENTPIEFIHLLWIGQSSRNQPQVFTALGAQQPGDFMKNSDPDGALGLCTSIVYRSWAYFQQENPYEEFVTEDGVAYWYDKRTGETFWIRPILPAEKYRGKDGDIDGVLADGVGERATLGVGADEPRYATQSVRKFITKSMEEPEEVERRKRQVAASAKRHDITVELSPRPQNIASQRKDLPQIQVPTLSFKPKPSNTAAATPSRKSIQFQTTNASHSESSKSPSRQIQPQSIDSTSSQAVDSNTKQLIETITQALGSALPTLGAAGSLPNGVEMLQFGIGLGMGLGLRAQQQPSQAQSSNRASPEHLSTLRSENEDMDENDDVLSTSRSDGSTDGSMTNRSTVSLAPSVDISPSPDELELLGEGPSTPSPGHGKKIPGYNTHPPPGEGTVWIDKPINASADSQTAVDGFGGALHQRVACLPKDFVAAVTSTKTCKMQANYLPVVKNMNQPRSVGIVRPRGALEEWLVVGYSPWSAGRAVFGTEFIDNLMSRPELLEKMNSNSGGITSVSKISQPAQVSVERKDNVSQAVRESQQLEAVMSLCRHGKYDEVEVMLNSPDWTLNIDAQDTTGNTLLSIACQNNNKRIAKLCLRRGADINTQNLNGQSVLHYCHEYGFHDLMEYLMDKGARDDLLNSDGLTCYEGLSKEAVDAL